jgi:nucleoside-diphosphate-sugar epimerase
MIGVTGANGLLGSFIVRKLIDAGEAFVAFKREASDISLLADIQEKIQWRDLDLMNPITMDDALQGVTAVIHCAAMVSFNPAHADQISDINIKGTAHIVNACQANHIKRLVFISSVAALGRVKGQTVIDEKNKWVDNSLNTTYALSKYLAELEVFRGQEEGLSTVIVNPSVILAPADWQKSSAQLFRYVWNERPFYIEGSINYVDVRDVASICYSLLWSDIENQRFIVNAGTTSYKKFFEAVALNFGRKPPSVKLSKIFLKIVASLEVFRGWITRSEPLITQETARLAGTYFTYENKKIKNSIHFEFTTLENTLVWCCRYYMQKFGFKKR